MTLASGREHIVTAYSGYNFRRSVIELRVSLVAVLACHVVLCVLRRSRIPIAPHALYNVIHDPKVNMLVRRHECRRCRYNQEVKLWKWVRRVFYALCAGLVLLALTNWAVAVRRSRPLDRSRLEPAEKAQLSEALRLKRTLGDRVWPGFRAAAVPVILFNDRYEFLVEAGEAPEPWEPVHGDDFEGKPYFRRAADNPQAFAVPVGDRWAGSLGTVSRMNREYLNGVRGQLPPVLAQLFPFFMATVGTDMHVAALLHEIFHAHEATAAAGHFNATRPYDRRQPEYPYENAAFAAAWDSEGAALHAALQAPDADAARRLARDFVQRRDGRRSAAKLPDSLREYERHMEWLEGLAKHVEIRAYELAADGGESAGPIKYRAGLPWWQHEFGRMKTSLGRQPGDHRFYVSGMGQARLLDIIAPGWQNQAFEGQTCLEDLVRAAVR